MKQIPLFIWKYLGNDRNWSGFHLTGEPDAFKHVISELSKPQHPDKRKVRLEAELSEATKKELAVPNSRSKAISFRRVHFQLLLRETSIFEVSENNLDVSISFSADMFTELVRGFDDIASGRGDYCIGDENNSLWFWWKV